MVSKELATQKPPEVFFDIWILINLLWMVRGFLSQAMPSMKPVFSLLVVVSFFVTILLFIVLAINGLNKRDIIFVLSILFILLCLFFVQIIIRPYYTFSLFINGIRPFYTLYLSLVIWAKFYPFYSNRINSFFIKSGVIQIPISLFQVFLLSHSPTDSNTIIFDVVGGSLGAGCSGVLTEFLYILSFYCLMMFFKLRREKKYLWFSIIILLPSLINETKIIFLLIPFYLMVYFDFRIKNLFFLVLGIAAFYGVIILYNRLYPYFGSPLSYLSKEFIYSYMLKGFGGDYDQLTRWQKLFYLFTINKKWYDWLFGYGMGLLRMGYNIQKSTLGTELYYCIKGENTIIGTYLFEGGVIYLSMILCTLVGWLRSTTKSPISRKVREYTALVLLISLVYNTPIVNEAFSSFLAFVFVSLRHFERRVNVTVTT